jgi:alanine racemase
MTRPARALIDIKAMRANLQRVRTAAPSSRVLAVIKANGYGHGIIRTAETLHEADAFGVACLEEGVLLREAGIAHPIVLLEGFFDDGELAEIARNHLSVVVHHEHQLRLLEAADLPRPLSVWLKIDTGMHRLGFAPEQAAAVFGRLRACRNVVPRIRLMTHLANADVRDDPLTERQIALFDSAVAELPGERSIANSAGILGWPQSHADWVRPGIMLYGASPFADSVGREEKLRPVMTLSSRLIAINLRRRGDALGYGGVWVCPEDMAVGVVGIGYGDGYPRVIADGTPVWIRGRRAGIIGRVSMDMLSIDLRNLPDAQVGDKVELWGSHLPVEEIAHAASTIAYDLLCGITQRVAIVEV